MLDKQNTIKRLLTRRQIEPVSECWIWTGCKFKRRYGYGAIKIGPTVYAVHRLAAFVWLDLDLSSGLRALHRCDNPPCFNPDHLFIGTQADNIADMIAKGRGRDYSVNTTVGEGHGRAKMTNETARLILSRHRRGERVLEIAKDLGVSRYMASSVVNGRNWRHACAGLI